MLRVAANATTTWRPERSGCGASPHIDIRLPSRQRPHGLATKARRPTQKAYDLLTGCSRRGFTVARMRTLVLAAGWLSLIVLVLPVRV
jgi:hypothetical protein